MTVINSKRGGHAFPYMAYSQAYIREAVARLEDIESWRRDHNEGPPLARSVSLIKTYESQRKVLKRTRRLWRRKKLHNATSSSGEI